MSSVAYPNAQAIFYQQYEAVRRDEIVGILLALFLGTFGIHHFYLRRTGLGILYCCFFWSGIPAMLGFFECFFMPGRVREFNAIQAAGIAAAWVEDSFEGAAFYFVEGARGEPGAVGYSGGVARASLDF